MVKTRLLDQFQTYFTHFVALDTLRCWNIVLGRTFQDFLPETVCPMQTSFQINRIRYKCIYVLTILWLMWVAEAYIYISMCVEVVWIYCNIINSIQNPPRWWSFDQFQEQKTHKERDCHDWTEKTYSSHLSLSGVYYNIIYCWMILCVYSDDFTWLVMRFRMYFTVIYFSNWNQQVMLTCSFHVWPAFNIDEFTLYTHYVFCF